MYSYGLVHLLLGPLRGGGGLWGRAPGHHLRHPLLDVRPYLHTQISGILRDKTMEDELLYIPQLL